MLLILSTRIRLASLEGLVITVRRGGIRVNEMIALVIGTSGR